MAAEPGHVSWKHEDDKVIVFERAGLVFAFNFHPNKSFANYKVGVWEAGEYRVVLDTDAEEFGGHKRVDHSVVHSSFEEGYAGRRYSLDLYIPCRTAIVLARH